MKKLACTLAIIIALSISTSVFAATITQSKTIVKGISKPVIVTKTIAAPANVIMIGFDKTLVYKLLSITKTRLYIYKVTGLNTSIEAWRIKVNGRYVQ